MNFFESIYISPVRFRLALIMLAALLISSAASACRLQNRR